VTPETATRVLTDEALRARAAAAGERLRRRPGTARAADLIERLYQRIDDTGAELAVAKTGEQPHPVFSLMRRTVLDHLADFLKEGGRKIDAWYATLNVVEVGFDDEPEAFSNINTREELQAWESAPPS